MPSPWRVVPLTVRLFTTHRLLWLPFLIAGTVEALGVLLIWLAPHPPFSALLAPPLRFISGDQVLHYPEHLWYLYHAMHRIHLGVSVLVGAYCSALACVMVRQTHQGKTLSLRAALYGRQIRYWDVVLITVVAWLLLEGVTRGLPYLLPAALWAVLPVLAAALVVQTLLAYAIPAAVYDRLSWWRALARGGREAGQHPVGSFLVVAVPSSLVIGYGLFGSDAQVRQWMAETAPEVAVVFVVVRLLVQTVADAVLTVAVTHLWFLHRGNDK